MIPEEQRERVLALLQAKAWEVIGASVYVTAFWQERELPIYFEGFQEAEVWALGQHCCGIARSSADFGYISPWGDPGSCAGGGR